MKEIYIVFYLPSKDKRENPYISEKTYERHKDFMSYFPKNVYFFVATHQEEYLGEETFQPQFICKDNLWKAYNGERIEADLILGMTGKIEAKRIYHNPIKEICKDKRVIESLFSTYSFHSLECKNYSEVIKNFQKITTEKKVLKPFLLSQGEGIIIGESIPNESQLEGMYPYLLQEFFDTSDGFFRYKGVHDFRVVIVNGVISGAFLRIAPPGTLKANVKLGAKVIDIGSENIPDPIGDIIKGIEAYTSKKYPHRYYSIDFGVGKNGEIKIFEFNSSPALSTPSIRKHLALHIIKNILKIK